MIRIAICEDEKILRQQAIEYIGAYFNEAGLAYCIDDYEKGEQLRAVEHKDYTLLFLDVDLGEQQDGIQLASYLRKEGNTSEIIFLTSHQQEAYRAFEVDAFRYLIKPLQKESLSDVLDQVLAKIHLNKQRKKLCLKCGNTTLQLDPNNILYIENIGRKQCIYTRREMYEINHTMKELENQLKAYDFFRIHKSFLVHMKYIIRHTKDTVIVENGDELCISRLLITPFKEAFMAYIRRMV